MLTLQGMWTAGLTKKYCGHNFQSSACYSFLFGKHIQAASELL